MFHWSKEHYLYDCSNVIEICKDRDGGAQDVFVPLWFERETKRLKNGPVDNTVYSWEKVMPEQPPF